MRHSPNSLQTEKGYTLGHALKRTKCSCVKFFSMKGEALFMIRKTMKLDQNM
jgi:hypothetical protein